MSKKTTLKEVGETLAFIVEMMATKDDTATLQKTLDEHTRDLNIIKDDVKTNLDKRLQLEVRVTNVEKKVFGAPRG